ncbi:MAG: hypothetical protein IIW71_11195 [Treponema sp.]|nr:hypothetical protein [Treponema sp.]
MNEEKSSFDELVAGITPEERSFLLAKLNESKTDLLPVLQSTRDDYDSPSIDIKIKTESVFYKFFLWIRSFLTKRAISEIYNDDLLDNLAKKINKQHSGLITHNRRLLFSLFYERLKELKIAADYFLPHFASFNDNPGRFYVFLSMFIAPEISEKINQEADPYSIPLEREPTAELRTSLIKRMENILKSINNETKSNLYSAVVSLNWLLQFSNLPFIHFLAQFTSIISDSYTCPYVNARVDYSSFAKVLATPNPITNEVLEAIFLFPLKKTSKVLNVDTETEKALKDFLAQSSAHIAIIQAFISSVPIVALGKIVNEDFDWQVPSFGGGEDWFVKFKDEWKRVFDERWESWLRDRKKDQLKHIMEKSFGLDSFPELKFRPWASLWGGVTFRCEMTGGFLSWFALEKFNRIIEPLNILMLEGVFINTENRSELSAAINDLSEVVHQISDFVYSLAPEGGLGNIFEQIQNEHARTLKNQSTIESLIINAEANVRMYQSRFCDACRAIERVLHGVLDEEKTKDYESIQNLLTIKGHDNSAYRDALRKTRYILNSCRGILAEIEPLDLPKVVNK